MKITKNFIQREIVGEYVLIPTGDTVREFNGLITLTETAKFIWDHLEEAESFTALVDMITTEYEVERETAAKDAAELLFRLLAAGFIAPSEEGGNW